MIYAKAWLNLQIITASERSQNQKEKRNVFHKIPFIQKYKKWKLTYSNEELISVAEGRGSGRREGLTWAMRKHLGMVIGSLS